MDVSAVHDLDSLRVAISACCSCGLRAGCSRVVFGEGAPSARLVFCGEGPGAEEDRLGRPFVGAAGQLLDKMLAASGWDRFTHAYILNVVKCRPPGNRTPTPEEREACRPNLEAQFRLLQPKIVVLLGATALQTLINPEARITRMRGQWMEKEGVWYMPTYHPAALLRNPDLKKDAWSDLKRVIDKYRELIDPAHISPHYPAHP